MPAWWLREPLPPMQLVLSHTSEALGLQACGSPRAAVSPSTDTVSYRKHVVPALFAAGIVHDIRTPLRLGRKAR